ncbi:hypothetical protein CUS_6449 [Ruminococcus albus 8]|uniref:Uncharacterized protein n=1 Tax=Ruminococcus albus 8 TaxID=246199 RepID=E9S9Z8_RUMAL|nr:hypothetical protein CUS_6449 [Ruminococcus albus 8]
MALNDSSPPAAGKNTQKYRFCKSHFLQKNSGSSHLPPD